VNGDGEPDIVTRQKVGDSSCRHIDITLGSGASQQWTRLDPSPIDSSGFSDPPANEILRPRDLVVADLFGNRLPEIIAGFGPTPRANSPPGLGRLEVAIWANSCFADINNDGQTDLNDLSFLLASFGCLGGDGTYHIEADLDRDGCVGLAD